MFLQVQSCKLEYLYDEEFDNTNIKCIIILSVSSTSFMHYSIPAVRLSPDDVCQFT